MLHIDKVDGKVFHFDYEGLVSTTAAIVQVLIGYLVGLYVIKKGPNIETIKNLFLLGGSFLLIGFCWDFIYPISKKMWSSSYTIFTSGWALISLAILIYCLELRKIKNVTTQFFDVFGKNPLFIFVLSGCITKSCFL